MSSFKVWVKPVGESGLVTNGLAFPSSDSAGHWGEGLLMRWMGAESYEVRESNEPVNVDENGHSIRVGHD